MMMIQGFIIHQTCKFHTSDASIDGFLFSLDGFTLLYLFLCIYIYLRRSQFMSPSLCICFITDLQYRQGSWLTPHFLMVKKEKQKHICFKLNYSILNSNFILIYKLINQKVVRYFYFSYIVFINLYHPSDQFFSFF